MKESHEKKEKRYFSGSQSAEVPLSGGKHYLAKKIVKMMPPHIHYVEPYAGGLSVLFAKDPEGVSEVVNDLDGELTDFYKALQIQPMFKRFCRLVELTPFSEAEFMRGESTDPVHRAVRFFVRNRQSRQGLGKDFATLSRNRTRRGVNEQVSSWLSAVEGLPEVHERLRRVVVLNRDALDVIRQQDGESTLFYLDPPYLPETRSSNGEYGEYEMTVEDHEKMLEALSDIDGRFLLSGYDNDIYLDFERMYRWNKATFDLPNNASSSKSKERKTECVWFNYDEDLCGIPNVKD